MVWRKLSKALTTALKGFDGRANEIEFVLKPEEVKLIGCMERLFNVLVAKSRENKKERDETWRKIAKVRQQGEEEPEAA